MGLKWGLVMCLLFQREGLSAFYFHQWQQVIRQSLSLAQPPQQHHPLEAISVKLLVWSSISPALTYLQLLLFLHELLAFIIKTKVVQNGSLRNISSEDAKHFTTRLQKDLLSIPAVSNRLVVIISG